MIAKKKGKVKVTKTEEVVQFGQLSDTFLIYLAKCFNGSHFLG